MIKGPKFEAWEKLVAGKSLEGLGLPLRNGRYDLTGLNLPDPKVTGRFSTSVADVEVFSELTKVEGATWKDLDFSGSRLNRVLFFDCEISNCVFDKSRIQNWGFWRNSIENTSFLGSDLRKSTLGGVKDGERNSFREVDFSRADLRGSAFKAAEFVDCNFGHARLDKVDFAGSAFTRCVFAGELKEVTFRRTSFRGEDLPPNEMIDVDFSDATLRFVDFVGLDLDRVKFPADEDHLVLTNYKDSLDSIRVALSGQEDLTARKLAAYLGGLRKWAGTNQAEGLINLKDIQEVTGKEGVLRLKELYRATGTN